MAIGEIRRLKISIISQSFKKLIFNTITSIIMTIITIESIARKLSNTNRQNSRDATIDNISSCFLSYKLIMNVSQVH